MPPGRQRWRRQSHCGRTWSVRWTSAGGLAPSRQCCGTRRRPPPLPGRARQSRC